MSLFRSLPLLSLRARRLATPFTIAALLASASTHALELNTANRAQLEQVRGIGVVAAGRILSVREEGEFKSWDDFMQRVKGFKKAASARLSEAGLTIRGEAFPGARGEQANFTPPAAPPKVQGRGEELGPVSQQR